jgi:hypothetical protein
VVEWKGRVFTRVFAKAQGTVRQGRDQIATAWDLDVPLLLLQHEIATRGATAALSKAPPRFLVAYGQMTNGQRCRALIRMSLEGFRLASPSGRKPPQGGDPGLAGRGPNAAQPELITVSNFYIRGDSSDGKGSVPIGHTRAAKALNWSSSVNRRSR